MPEKIIDTDSLIFKVKDMTLELNSSRASARNALGCFVVSGCNLAVAYESNSQVPLVVSAIAAGVGVVFTAFSYSERQDAQSIQDDITRMVSQE